MLTYQYYRENTDKFKEYKSDDLMPLNCCFCHKLYHRTRLLVKRESSYYQSKYNYCTNDCHNKSRVVSKVVPCKNCGLEIKKIPSDIKKANNVFCDQSCSATYNNKNKKYGIRRSKLEKYLEDELKNVYPDLQIVVNGKETIGSELDFYFPQLKFAIELNGPTHYEPIYGRNKFEKIVENDKQKVINCYNQGIELLVVDVSKVSYLTQERKSYYLNLFKQYIDNLKHRLE
jgi:hypothetical protein